MNVGDSMPYPLPQGYRRHSQFRTLRGHLVTIVEHPNARVYDVYNDGVLRHPNATPETIMNVLAFYSGDLSELAETAEIG
jgi:hypothetical protein